MNPKIIFGAIGFVTGVIIGGSTALIICKKTYNKKMQEEVDAVWAEINTQPFKKKPDLKTAVEEAKIDKTVSSPEATDSTFFKFTKAVSSFTQEPQEMTDIIHHSGYTQPEIKKTNDTIYEITENDLDEDEYDIIELVLYADGILADDGDYPVRSLSDTVGENFHEIFTPDKDEIIIRNEKKKVDYDVVRSLLSYGEMLDRHPETEQRLQYDDAMERYYSEDADEEDGEEDDE